MAVFFVCVFMNYFVFLEVEYTYAKNMNLSEIKKHLQQVLQLVEDWDEKGVDSLERDLALGQLREIYSALRFDSTPQPESISDNEEAHPSTQTPNSTTKQSTTAEEELPVGIAISLDDVFDGFIPEDLIPLSQSAPAEEEPSEEIIPEEAEGVEPEATEDKTKPLPEVEEEELVAPEEEIAEGEEPEAEPTEEEVVVEEPKAEVATEAEEEEVVIAEEAATTEPTHTESVTMGQQSLFGDEELFVPRTSRRTRMMSLYDDEPAVAPQPKSEPKAMPKPVVEPEPEPTKPVVIESQPIMEEPRESIVENQVEEPISAPAEEEEFVEVDLDIAESESHAAEVAQESATPLPEEQSEPYIEPQIKISEATHIANAVPESEPVLGEVIKSDVQTIADTIKPQSTTAEQIAKGSISDLGKAVGINDRFLLIRDLFGGSSEEYERVIARLNDFENLEDCMIYIVENFDWAPNSDGAKLMMELLERKYS